jgi:methyl-accepting chemotaxis protein
MNNISIKLKLLILAVIPVLALLVISVDEGNRRLSDVSSLEQLKTLSILSTKISALVHETQKERGMTAGFLGSKGKKFSSKILKQRELTNLKQKELELFLSNIDLKSFGASSHFLQELNNARDSLSRVGSIRSQVNGFSINTKDAISFYTNMNSNFLNAIYEMVAISNDKDIVKKLSAYANFLLSKERAGIERAVGSNTFGRDNFGPGMKIKWNNLILQQDLYMDLFEKVASEKANIFYSSTMSGSDIDDVQKMRKIAFSKNSDFGIDAAVWFSTITSKINKLKKVEDYLSKDLIESIENIKNENFNTMIFHLGGAVFMMLLIAFVSHLIVSNTINSIERFQAGLTKFFDFVNGSTSSSSLINIDSKDEFGQMAKVVNTNIKKVEEDLIKDKNFIKDVSVISSKVTSGFYDQRINQDSNNQSLRELKEILNKMFDNLEKSNKDILNILTSFASKKYLEKLSQNNSEGSLKELILKINYLGNELSVNSYNDLSNGIKMQNSSEILESNLNELKKDANLQVNSINDTSAKLNDILENIHANADIYHDMIKIAKSVEKSSNEGATSAHDTSKAMDEIRNNTQAINESIESIDQIAFQTNILSLNAAVEAATAGEAGKGFAVVAGEVRNLASRSAEAAKDIKELVEKAISNTESGKDIAHKMSKGYDDLNSKILKTIGYIENVTNTNEVQTGHIKDVNNELLNVNKLTNNNFDIINRINELSMQSVSIANKLVEENKQKEFDRKEELLKKG